MEYLNTESIKKIIPQVKLANKYINTIKIIMGLKIQKKKNREKKAIDMQWHNDGQKIKHSRIIKKKKKRKKKSETETATSSCAFTFQFISSRLMCGNQGEAIKRKIKNQF